MSFTDNGNGTATLSGMPTATGCLPHHHHRRRRISPNATQAFTLTVGTPPAITSADSTTFSLGSDNSFSFTTTGSPTPTLTESARCRGA